MKRKLKIVLILITLSLSGIIIFQLYWSVNAYQVNKKNFDTNVDMAMQQALDSCKKDYFDSIRVVMVKRLSTPGTIIKIDTLHEADTIHKQLSIRISLPHSWLGEPFHITSNALDFYGTKINHRATLPELITETSFYVPFLMNQLTLLWGMSDISAHDDQIKAYVKAHSNIPQDSIFAHHQIVKSGMYELPPNYRQADSLKLHRYFTTTLDKMNIRAGFNLLFSEKGTPAGSPSMRYAETNDYPYDYHGFVFLDHSIFNHLHTRAVFSNPQYAIIKGMMITLVLSALLVLFTIYCFYYIIKTINQQKALGELKDDFINNMTHELKTPIATITVAIEGLQKFNALNDPEKTQRYLQTSRNELAKLNELVGKVLDVAAFERDKITLLKEKIQVDTLMNELITAERAKAGETAIITYNNRDQVDYIAADKLHFGNAILNVLDNAVKYSNEPADIKIDVYRDGNMIVFSVSDKGMGIPAAHLGRIFEKFHRVPTGNVHNVKGTGLGLSYVKYIAEAHGGHVAVKSEVNTGSQFMISIPM
ncbi:sensor histidine kinase KdpD [Mucilaginibacter sp. OK268]|uniref:sensor histidine kinase n=1 Tax=Mucilaginibacter sp. OK268 TaxID=1881048 RepID=UPI00115FCFDF|nr:HAMP domain-containing sensor histidine kinase [Mucilaginibacter sp. OK268]